MTFKNKYLFASLDIGQKHIVRGSDSHLAHNALNLWRKRNPDQRHRVFRTKTLLTGCLIERVK